MLLGAWSPIRKTSLANPHFSGLIGATHNDDVRFWAPGRRASDGIKAMAERGSKTPLDDEIRAAKADGTVDKLLSGDGIARSPASVSLDFVIRRDHPLVTLVSMVAPRPRLVWGRFGFEPSRRGPVG